MENEEVKSPTSSIKNKRENKKQVNKQENEQEYGEENNSKIKRKKTGKQS